MDKAMASRCDRQRRALFDANQTLKEIRGVLEVLSVDDEGSQWVRVPRVTAERLLRSTQQAVWAAERALVG